MTLSPQSHHDYSFAEYLALERDSDIKHEFDTGEILAMAGGTARPSALAVNVAFACAVHVPPVALCFSPT